MSNEIHEEKTGFPSIDKTHLKGIPIEKLQPQIMPLSILSIFYQINSLHLDEIAIESDGVVYSKRRFYEDSILAAKSLLSCGVKPGEKIALATTNCYQGIVAMCGANCIGVGSVILNQSSKNLYEISEEAAKFDAKVLFVSSRSKMEVVMMAKKFPSIKFFVDIESSSSSYSASEWKYSTFDIFIKLGEDFDSKSFLEIQEKYRFNEEPTIFLQTSGSSSGKPKTLPFSNRAIFASLIYASNSTGTKTRDKSVSRVLCILPYRLPYGWMTIFVNLMGGNQVVLASGSEVSDISKYYKLKPSYVYGTPAIFRIFMDTTPKNADLSFMTAFFCSGFSLPESWFLEGKEYFRNHNSKAEIRNNYGIGEGLCIGTASDGIPHKEGTSGKFYVGPKWKLVDEDMNEVKYGEVGEAIVSSESLCQGYYGDEEATKLAFFEDDGEIWYKTGDLMILHEDGYVSIVGRKSKRFFQPAGAPDKVNCLTIEEAVLKCKLIEDAACVAVPGRKGIDEGYLFIVRKEDTSSDFPICEAAKHLLSQLLLDFQIPAHIIEIDQIPLMDSGKPNYVMLENMCLEK